MGVSHFFYCLNGAFKDRRHTAFGAFISSLKFNPKGGASEDRR